jgi:hypothetical protein
MTCPSIRVSGGLALFSSCALTGHGKWSPQRSAQVWIRFCLKAHYQQAATLIRRNEEYSRIYEAITDLIIAHNLDERSSLPLFDTALGLRLTNIRYRTDANVSELVASRDLKKLCEAGLLTPYGERRGRIYRAASPLLEIREKTRQTRQIENPYEVAARRRKRQIRDEEMVRLPGL